MVFVTRLFRFWTHYRLFQVCSQKGPGEKDPLQAGLLIYKGFWQLDQTLVFEQKYENATSPKSMGQSLYRASWLANLFKNLLSGHGKACRTVNCTERLKWRICKEEFDQVNKVKCLDISSGMSCFKWCHSQMRGEPSYSKIQTKIINEL